MANRKRKIHRENRAFQESWETDFFFINCGGQPLCLLCNVKLAQMKKLNLSRHYVKYHAETYDTYSAQRRVEALTNLKMQYNNQEEEKRQTCEQQSIAASYSVALEIARAKKCFSDGELIKKCAIEMAKAFGNDSAVKCFETVSLSRQTISRRISKISEHISDKLKTLLQNCKYFSLCLDESTDVTDLSQLSIFVRSIDDNFSISEELLAIVPLRCTTQGIDIFKAFHEKIEEYGGFSKCTAIVTDGAKAMVGQEKGLKGLLKKNGINCPTFHCIIHQEALCGKIVKLNSTMKMVTKVVNSIRGGNKALLHRKFKMFLQEMDAAYSDLVLYNEVRWLSAGKTLERFFGLRKEIPEFLQKETKTESCILEKFKDIKFLWELAFLTDITKHLNCLNTKLQAENQTISDLIGHINGFRNQIELFIAEWEMAELYHFPACKEIAEEHHNTNFDVFLPILMEIAAEFNARFADFDLLKQDLIIFNNPKGCTIQEQKIEYRMELCTLQADPFILSRKEYGLEFFKLLHQEKYPKLIDLGLKICSMFGSTYKCETAFSIMKCIKSKYRSTLSDDSLSSLMKIATTKTSIDVQSLVDAATRPQSSH